MAGHLEDEATANAERIVTAVNSHDDLLAALEGLVDTMELIIDGSLKLPANSSVCTPAKQALAQARGE